MYGRIPDPREGSSLWPILACSVLPLSAVLLLGFSSVNSPDGSTPLEFDPLLRTEDSSGHRTQLPPGVPTDWWSQARAGLIASEYEVSHDGLQLQAPNRAQNLRTYFRDGMIEIVPRTRATGRWSWQWKSSSWGRPDAMQDLAAAPPISEGAKVEYRYAALTEWYENDPDGLEQGFTIHARPSGEGPLCVEGSIEGNLAARIEADRSEIVFHDDHGAAKLCYRNLHVEDRDGTPLVCALALEENRVRIEIDDSHATYPIFIDPILSTPNWSVEGGQDNAHYGFSVATAGDVNGDGYSDLVIGAYSYDLGQTDEGIAVVYHGSETGLANDWSWRGQSNQIEAWYGVCVAPAGDVNGDGFSDVLIGAYRYDSGQPDEGSAFLYLGSVSGLEPGHVWEGEVNQENAQYGRSLSTAGDVNGDGYSDVIVGAPQYTAGSTAEGSAFLYFGSDTGLPAGPVWSGQGNQEFALYGWDVSTAGDVNADGYADLIIGAPMFDGQSEDGGRVYVYHGSPSGPSQNPAWITDGSHTDSRYGWSVSNAGDVDGDGYGDVAIGEPNFDGDSYRHGRAYIFGGSATGVENVAAWITEGNTADSHGWSVATAGDVNGDGYADVLVGANEHDGNRGYASLYLGSWSGISTTPAWTVDGDQAGCDYGVCVATAGDVNGDGFSDLAIGAWRYSDPETEEGRVYVYHGSSDGPRESPGWVIESNQEQAAFGGGVSMAGDVNGDGYGDVLVGAGRFDNGQEDEGAIFLYLGGAQGLKVFPDWYAESNQVNGRLGWVLGNAVDVNGDGISDVLAGCPVYDVNFENDGAVFVWYGSASGAPMGHPGNTDWMVSGSHENHLFGDAVDGAGDVNGDGCHEVIVGVENEGDLYQGGAYLFLGSPTGPSTTPDWQIAGESNHYYLGRDVACAGDFNGDGLSDVAVTVPGYEEGNNFEGAVFVYYGSTDGIPATPSWIAQSNEDGAGIGSSVASAGDVNGDGYSDLIVGAPTYSEYLHWAGAAFLWLGADGGPPEGHPGNAQWIGYGGVEDMLFGFAVASAGDVNGDGYSDVLVGAPEYGTTISEEGRAYFFFGSETGLEATPAWYQDGDQTHAWFGRALSSAGDVNADGFSDILIGASGYTNGEAAEGRAFLYYGNDSRGLARLPWQEGTDNGRIHPLGLSNSENACRLQTYLRTAAGRDRVRLIYEVEPYGTPLDGTNLRVSPYLIDTGLPDPDLGSAVVMQGPVTNLSRGTPHHWRLCSVSPNPYFPRSPWITLAYNGVTETDLRTAGTPSAVDSDAPAPLTLQLFNHPNPFQGSTQFVYALPARASVRLVAYDLQGRRVDTIFEGESEAGLHAVTWDACRGVGRNLPSGVYFVRLTAGNLTVTKKVQIGR